MGMYTMVSSKTAEGMALLFKYSKTKSTTTAITEMTCFMEKDSTTGMHINTS